MAKKSKYTRSQKIAYYSGMGYGVSHQGRRVTFKRNPELRNNFRKGYNHGINLTIKYPDRYPVKFTKKGGK